MRFSSVVMMLSAGLAVACSDGAGTGQTGSIEGQVWAPSIEGDSLPLPGANVFIYRSNPCSDHRVPCPEAAVITAQAVTDAAGRYALRNVPPESYIAAVNSPMNMAVETQPVAVEVRAGESVQLSFHLTRAGSVTTDTTHTDSTGTTPKPVVMVAIQPNNLAMNVGDSTGVYAQLKAADSSVVSGRTVTWTVSDATVLRLDAYGQSALLRALKSGSVQLTATVEGRTGYAAVTVR